MHFTGDELVLALISLVRAAHPRMLRQEADGFSVDFEALSKMKTLGPDERLLLKMRTVLEPPAPDGPSDVLPQTNAETSPETNPETNKVGAVQPDGPAHLDQPAEGQLLSLDLAPAEAHRLAQTLGHLETLQRWPADVLEMSRALRARLTTKH